MIEKKILVLEQSDIINLIQSKNPNIEWTKIKIESVTPNLAYKTSKSEFEIEIKYSDGITTKQTNP